MHRKEGQKKELTINKLRNQKEDLFAKLTSLENAYNDELRDKATLINDYNALVDNNNNIFSHCNTTIRSYNNLKSKKLFLYLGVVHQEMVEIYTIMADSKTLEQQLLDKVDIITSTYQYSTSSKRLY